MKLTIPLFAAFATAATLNPAMLTDCSGEPPDEVEDCADGIDNDRDLEVDCNDTDCWGGTDLLVTEIQMHPAEIADVDGEYIEFRNFGDRCVDMSRWTISEDSGLPPTSLPSNSWVKPGASYVIAGEFFPDDNCGVYANASFYYDSTLNDDHDAVIIREADGSVFLRLEYCNGTNEEGCIGSWPSCPTGAAMEYCGPESTLSNADGIHWQCATTAYGCGDLGTPKAANSCQ